MNAYELADELWKFYDEGEMLFLDETIAILRQQAKRIEELEQVNKALSDSKNRWKTACKELAEQPCSHGVDNGACKECYEEHTNQEPVAYWDGKHFASKEKSSLADIPVYTHPYKELSDEEIASIWKKQWEGGNIGHIAYTYAKAIIKASRGKE